jgi:hypothetical protein
MQVVILVFAMSGPAWIGWVKLNAEDLNVDSLRVVHGLAIKASTSPDATIAVTPCGSIPYFSERRTLDILGKSDAVIAREPPKGLPFFPGHSKWNLQHTIGEGKPDMIDELYTAKKEDLRYVYDQGYTPISAALWWRNDSNKAHSLAFVVEAGRLGAYH